MSKILSAITIAGVVALSLVACSSTGAHDGSTAASSACVATKAGSASNDVKVSGKFGAEPKVTFATPLATTKTERTIDSKGAGTAALENSAVTLNYSVFNATSGKQIDTTGFGKSKAQPLTLTSGSIIPGLYKAILCAPQGSRVTAVVPPADAFGTAGQPSLGIAATDSIVFVLDVVSASKPVKALAKANGTEQPAPKGFPTVKLAKNGAPTVAVPKGDAPTTLKIADLKKGAGATVKKGASVTVQYTGLLWATGKTFDSSWSHGQTATFKTDQVVPGFGAALVGQKVGSQVIAILPPAEGYGATPPQGSGISATDTLVFVIDILATQ